MKRINSEIVVKKAVDKLIRGNVNSACFYWFHQPKLPKGAEKFRKK